MAAINTRRVLLGGAVGGVVWSVWSILINVLVLASRYADAQKAGNLLAEPRYGLFIGYWTISLFLISGVLAWLYAGVRATFGAGPRTALALGVLAGFAIAFPMNLSMATWGTFGRIFPTFWMLDLWVGAILATFIAAWLYKE